MELRVEDVVLAVVIKLRERRKGPVGARQDDWAHCGIRGEGNRDAVEGGVERVPPAIEPDDRVFHGLAGLIDHGEEIATRPRALQRLPLPDAHQRAAAAAATDELNDPRASAPFERRELKVLPGTFEMPDLDLARLFAVGDEPIEVQIRVQLPLLREEEIEGIYLVDFDEQLRRVLDRHIERHVGARSKELRIGLRELDID